ncbi:MAG: hypothetical protein MI892_27565 [Desulfobacterales bacterium]|nr:hypothetical protein [Desulfobacterales bacterium]
MESKSTEENNLIGPKQLEIDATMPQCLDNQYVSDNTMQYMLQNEANYDDSSVKELRQTEVHNEFIRSLVYSSQVVINRAFLKNNEFLYSNYSSENLKKTSDFAELIRTSAIVPYLFTEKSLTDKLEFDVRKPGDRAIKSLLEQTGHEIPCVRLDVDDNTNQLEAAKIESKFGEYLAGLKNKSELLINAMSSEVFDRSLETEEWNLFLKHIDGLSKYAHDFGRGLKRNHVYSKWFIEENTDVSEGLFKKPPANLPYLYQLKKIVDLRYNSNLPDALGIYTFTPVGLPSRVALQDFSESSISSRDIEKFVDQQLTKIKRIFMADSQKAMNLPLLKDLSISDVVDIRNNIDEWSEFKESRQKTLSDPLNILNNIDDFQQSFDNFHLALSGWYNKKYQRKKTEKFYSSFVTVALQIAGQTILLGVDFKDNQLAQLVTHSGVAIIPEKVKGYAVKLLINVIDIGKMKLDTNRSHSYELLQSNQELSREDVIQLINSIKSIEADKIESSGPIADQGKK